MALDFTALQAAVAQIKTDAAQNATDIQAAIAKLGTVSTDPANQAIIDGVVSDLGGVKTAVEGSNAALEAAVNPPPAAPTT